MVVHGSATDSYKPPCRRDCPFIMTNYYWSDCCFGVLHRWPFLFLLSSSSSRSSKTFKPKKNIPEGTHQYDLMKHAAATLGSGNLRNAVALPDGEDPNEWVAVNSE